MRIAAGGRDGDDASALPDDRTDRRTEADIGAPAAMQREKMPRDFRRDDAAHQPVGGFEHSHGLAEEARGRRDFEADEPAADHDHVARRMETRAQDARVVGMAKRADAVEADTLDRRQARTGAGCNHDAVEWQRAAVGETQLTGAAVDGRRFRAEAKIDTVLDVERHRPERQKVVLRILEERLGERRPLVRHVDLGGHQRQRAVVAIGPEAGGYLRAAVPAADDDDALLVQGCPG